MNVIIIIIIIIITIIPRKWFSRFKNCRGRHVSEHIKFDIKYRKLCLGMSCIAHIAYDYLK